MFKWITILFTSLALSFGAIAEAMRTDVVDHDGFGYAIIFISKPASPSGAKRQSSADANSLRSHSCDELWYQRNAILWSSGYCFHEPRAVRVFRNAACGYRRVYEVPLTSRDSQLLNLLEMVESAKGCPIDN
jgi:hypothetical protein